MKTETVVLAQGGHQPSLESFGGWLINKVTKQVHAEYRNYPSPDELISEGVYGATRALSKFDPTRGFAPSTYFLTCSRNEIRHLLASQKRHECVSFCESPEVMESMPIDLSVVAMTYTSMRDETEIGMSVELIDEVRRVFGPESRQTAVVSMRCAGLSNVEIAERLRLSDATVGNTLRDMRQFILKWVGHASLAVLQ